jgi:cell division transport system permease protein
MLPQSFGAADRKLFPEGRLAGPMPWVIAIMMFLTVLAAAAGLALAGTADRIAQSTSGGFTVQILAAEPQAREAEALAAERTLRALPQARSVQRVADAELKAMLRPWFGAAGMTDDLPVPAMIEAELAPDSSVSDITSALAAAAPSARVDASVDWLAPVLRLVSLLKWIAAGLVLLTAAATAAIVVLAARAALNTHRDTIEVLHLMGAKDGQIARLFQRRIALDALFGGLVGLAAAALLLVAVGGRIAALGSELVGSADLPAASWLLLLLLPLLGALLAMLVARATIVRALSRLL